MDKSSVTKKTLPKLLNRRLNTLLTPEQRSPGSVLFRLPTVSTKLSWPPLSTSSSMCKLFVKCTKECRKPSEVSGCVVVRVQGSGQPNGDDAIRVGLAHDHDSGKVGGQTPPKALAFSERPLPMPKRGAPADTPNHWLCDGDQC